MDEQTIARLYDLFNNDYGTIPLDESLDLLDSYGFKYYRKSKKLFEITNDIQKQIHSGKNANSRCLLEAKITCFSLGQLFMIDIKDKNSPWWFHKLGLNEFFYGNAVHNELKKHTNKIDLQKITNKIFKSSINHLTMAYNGGMENGAILGYMGACSYRLEDYALAAKYCKKGLDFGNHNIKNIRLLGLSLCNIGEYENSIHYLEHITAADEIIYESLGKSHTALGNHQTAIENLEKAMVDEKSNSEMIGYNYYSLGEYRDALKYLFRGVDDSGKNSDSATLLIAKSLFELGSFKSAAKHFETLELKGQDTQEVVSYLCKIYEK